MDIAFIIPRLDSFGGAEKYFYNVAKLLSKRNDVTVYTTKYSYDLFPDIKESVNVIKTPSIFDQKKQISTILDLFMIKYIRNKILESHELYNMHLFPTNFLDLKPNVLTMHEPPRMLYDLEKETLSELSFFKKMIAKLYFPILRRWDLSNTNKNIDVIIANSRNSKKYIKRIYDKKVYVVYPGVDKKLLTIKNSPEKMILSVGRLYKAKRIDLIIIAFKKVVDVMKDYKLVIVGKGPEEHYLKSLAKKLKIYNKVLFVGEIDENKLYYYYKRAKLTVYTPTREMFGMVPIESIATGTPVVGVKEGGYTEIIGDAAELVNPDIDEISSAVIEYLTNSKKYKKASMAGKKIARRYSWSIVAKETYGIFKDVLRKY